MKKTYLLGILFLFCCILVSCSNSELQNQLRSLRNSIASYDRNNIDLLNSLSNAYYTKSIPELRRLVNNKYDSKQKILNQLNSELRKVNQDRDEIRAVSSIFSNIEESQRRFRTQYDDIMEQHNIFIDRNQSFKYIATRLAMQSALQEMEDINSNVIRQCELQKSWHNEVIVTNTERILSIGWNEKKYEQMTKDKLSSLNMNFDKIMQDVKNVENYHDNFNFHSLESMID